MSNQLPVSQEFPKVNEAFDQTFSVHMKRISDSVNTKEGALYLLNEIANFKQYFTQGNPQVNRAAYRKTFDLVNLNGGNIAPGAMAPVAHGISGISSAALIYVGCTNTTPNYFTVVYPNIYLDNTNIYFTNPSAAPLTQAYAVCEYLKN